MTAINITRADAEGLSIVFAAIREGEYTLRWTDGEGVVREEPLVVEVSEWSRVRRYNTTVGNHQTYGEESAMISAYEAACKRLWQEQAVTFEIVSAS